MTSTARRRKLSCSKGFIRVQTLSGHDTLAVHPMQAGEVGSAAADEDALVLQGVVPERGGDEVSDLLLIWAVTSAASAERSRSSSMIRTLQVLKASPPIGKRNKRRC